MTPANSTDPTATLPTAFDRWLAGDATPEDERHLRAAAADDPELAAELERYRELSEQLRELPTEEAPGHDLWPGVAARIRRSRRRTRLRGAVAAGLVAAAAGVAYVATRPAPAPAPVAEHPTVAPPEAVLQRTAFAATETELERLRIELRRAIEARRDALPPATREDVFRNLATIERAIADLEAALGRSPGDAVLARTYIRYRERELDLLRRANQAAARL